MEQEVDFNLEDGKTVLKINQKLTDEEFSGRVENIKNSIFNMQKEIESNTKEILRLGKTSEDTKKFIANAEKDYEKAINFLKKIHKEDLIIKIEKKCQEYQDKIEEAGKNQEKLNSNEEGGN
jgi:hypothetical protein